MLKEELWADERPILMALLSSPPALFPRAAEPPRKPAPEVLMTPQCGGNLGLPPIRISLH